MGKKSSSQRSGNYEVGKGRPPRTSRWKPGQSGNPKGRPKGAKNFKTLLDQALSRMLKIQEGGKTRSITAREGIVMTLVNKALKGEPRAIALLFANDAEMMQTTEPFKEITMDMTVHEAAAAYDDMLKNSGRGR